MADETILIIDDNADMRLVLSLRLKAQGHRTVFVSDALEAITMARHARPDAIPLDLGFPGSNGFLVLDRLKAIPTLAPIPVIIVTAEDPQAAEARTIEGGAIAFLQQPVDQDKLMAAVQQAVGTT